MKKITLLLAVLLTSFNTFAQLPAGSTAPDFTVTDINGNTHTLSTYLAAGKTVIMDISATWCGPCWNYHNTHNLEDIYNAYGVNGSNEVVVLFVEGDAATTLANLNGTGNTQGNWVAGTPYPIIDSSAIAQLYQITYFPTVYRICPNGIVNEIGAASAGTIKSGINTNCGATMTGVQNYARAYDNTIGLCTTTGSPSVKLKNYGVNTITAAVVNLKENGNVVGTKTSTGTFAQFANKTITFDPLVFNPASTYTYEIATINGALNFNNLFTNSNLTVSLAQDTPTLAVEVRVSTDNYPTEMSWRIKNGTTIVASGGPYVGNANGGGADANTVKIHNITLPVNNICYTVELVDSYGDGWGSASAPESLEIFSNGTSVLNISSGGNFGTLLTKANALKAAEQLATTSNVKESFNVYPNPSNGVFNFASQVEFNIEVVDVLGKTVFTKSGLNNDSSINLSHLQSGVYIAKINTESASFTEKLIIK